MNILTNGFGGTAAADALAASAPVYTSQSVYYVSSIVGDDANAGTSRESPKATLDNAMSTGGNGSVIVLMAGHAETYTDLIWKTGVTVVGEGIAAGVPTVKLTPDIPSGAYAMVMASMCELRNVTIAAYGSSCNKPKVSVRYSGARLVGVRFECGPNDADCSLALEESCADSAQYLLAQDCTFVSTATAVANRPYTAVKDAYGAQGATFDGCVFDGGTVGFSSGRAFVSGGAASYRRLYTCSLLNGADIFMYTTTTGIVSGPRSTGEGTVVW